jgi:hypothetical protein
MQRHFAANAKYIDNIYSHCLALSVIKCRRYKLHIPTMGELVYNKTNMIRWCHMK